MIRPGVLVSGVVAVVTGICLAVAVPALGSSAATASPAGYAWKASAEVPGTATLNTGDAMVFSVSCASPGNCGAGGFYTAADNGEHPFVANEVNGTWGTAQALPGNGSFNSTGQVIAVSCPEAGDCAAVGGYFVAGVQRVFVDEETGGVWGTPSELPGTAALAAIDAYVEVRTLSCASAGNCTAAGDYRDAAGHTQPFVADESGGTWGDAQELPVPVSLSSYDLNAGYNDNEVVSVSCPSPGDCTAAGNSGNPMSSSYAWVADETNGTWGTALPVLGVAANGGTVTDVSCGSAGTCAAVGQYATGPISNHAFVMDEAAGTWGVAQELPGSAALDSQNIADLHAVSCPSAGNCTAVGLYGDAAGRKQVLADSETSGVWATATALPASGIPSVPNFTAGSVSCASPGNCVAGGSYVDEGNAQYAFIVTQAGGTWGKAQSLSGVASTSARYSEVRSISCVPAGPCAMGGGYWEVAGGRSQAWVANQVPVTRTTITRSAKSVSYGDEQAARLSVVVSASSGKPGGTVKVTAGSTTVCSIVLTAGTGACTLKARQFQPGTVHLTATYGGSQGFAGSSSATVLTVTKETTGTALGLSVTKAKYGKEQAVRFTVAVRPRYSGAAVAGKVRIKDGTATVCTIVLSGAKGGCTLKARQLTAGKHLFTAAYAGSADFAGSVSAPKMLTITK